jgi:hypothetical protein
LANENTVEQCEIIETELSEVNGGMIQIDRPSSKCGIGSPVIPLPKPLPVPLPWAPKPGTPVKPKSPITIKPILDSF